MESNINEADHSMRYELSRNEAKNERGGTNAEFGDLSNRTDCRYSMEQGGINKVDKTAE